jgi:prefoldin subunit 5
VAKRRSRDIRSRSAKVPSSTRNDVTPPSKEQIRLKPVLQQIQVSLDQLKRLKQQTDRVKYAITQLQQSEQLIAAICTDRGCGSDMAFPPSA